MFISLKVVSVLVFVVFLSGMFIPACFAADSCGVTKTDVIKSIIAHITQKSDISRGQVMVLIKAYLGSANCGSNDVRQAKEKANVIDNNVIPKCSDGTLFAHCSVRDRPKYCYSGRLVDRCDLCCESGRCGPDGKCETQTRKVDCEQAYGSGFFCGTYADWKGQCHATGQIKDLSYEKCSDTIDGAQYCIKCENPQDIIDCKSRYGKDYWCSTYDEWKLECKGSGQAVDLGDAKCYDSGSALNDFCSTCISSDCHTHTNPSWIDNGVHRVKIVQLGCTRSGCAEGSGNATEVLVETREGIHCGEQFWVWIDNIMSRNVPVVGVCYMTEIFTEMYGPNCGYVIRYLVTETDCPECTGHDVTGRGDPCVSDVECNPPLVCKTSGRYDGSQVGHVEKYCCYADECASVISGPCVAVGGTDIRDAPYPHMALSCVLNSQVPVAEYIVDCEKTFGVGYWCGTYADWNGQCHADGDMKELSTPGCSLDIPDAQYCIKCA